MLRSWIVGAAVLCLAGSGCYASSARTDGDAGVDADAGVPSRRGRVDAAVVEPDAPIFAPDCPDGSTHEPPSYPCDPLSETSCGIAGQACYPIASGSPTSCGGERYGSICSFGGGGRQGSPCTTMNDCAATFGCIFGPDGTQCLLLCRPDAAGSVCPRGELCVPIDVEGFGACN